MYIIYYICNINNKSWGSTPSARKGAEQMGEKLGRVDTAITFGEKCEICGGCQNGTNVALGVRVHKNVDKTCKMKKSGKSGGETVGKFYVDLFFYFRFRQFAGLHTPPMPGTSPPLPHSSLTTIWRVLPFLHCPNNLFLCVGYHPGTCCSCPEG